MFPLGLELPVHFPLERLDRVAVPLILRKQVLLKAVHGRTQLSDLILEGLTGSRSEPFPGEDNRLVDGHTHGCRASIDERHLTRAVQHPPDLSDDRCSPGLQPGSEACGNATVAGEVDQAPDHRGDAEQLADPADRVGLGRVHRQAGLPEAARDADIYRPTPLVMPVEITPTRTSRPKSPRPSATARSRLRRC